MSSKSSSRSKYSHFSIGFSTSVLKDDFVLAFETDENFDIKSWLPVLAAVQGKDEVTNSNGSAEVGPVPER